MKKMETHEVIFVDGDLEQASLISDKISKKLGKSNVFLDTTGTYPELRVYCTSVAWDWVRAVIGCFKIWIV